MVEAIEIRSGQTGKTHAGKSEQALLIKIDHRAEARFYILFLLGLGTYIISASIGSGWVLFITCGLFACCILAVLLPFLILKSCRVELSAPEQVSAGDNFSVTVELSSNKFM